MKKKNVFWASLILLGVSLSTSQASAYEATFSTGKDWEEKMSDGEKFMSLLAPMILFNKYGVPFRHTAPEYIAAMDKIILYNPYLEKEEVANIFASTVYAYEPESHPAIRAMIQDFQYLKLGYLGYTPPWPSLVIRNQSEVETENE